MELSLESGKAAKRSVPEVVASKLEKDVSSQKLAKGTRLLPLRLMAEKYNTSYLTMRKAVNALCDKGVLSSRHGAGVFVASDKIRSNKESGKAKTKTFAAVFCGMQKYVTSHRIYSRLLNGIEQIADQKDYELVISLLRDAESFRQTTTFENSAGFFMIGDDKLANLKSVFKDKPAVWLMGTSKSWGDCITYDNKAIGNLAAERLVKKGHDRLAYLNVDKPVGSERCQAFAEKAVQLGAKVDCYDNPNALVKSESEEHVDSDILRSWLTQINNSKPRPTALFVVDMIAHPVYNLLMHLGLVPGKDIEIATCDWSGNTGFGTDYKPLSIEIHPEEIGIMGVQRLEWRLDNPSDREIIVKLAPTLEE